MQRLFTFLLVLAPVAAWAQPAATARVYEEEAGPALTVELERALGETLRLDGRLAFVPYVDLLTPPSAIAKQQAEVQELVAKADAAWEELNVQLVKDLLDKAFLIESGILESRVAQPDGLKPIHDILTRLARTRYLDADQRGARDALRQLYALRGSLAPTSFPPQMKKLVVESRLLFETLGQGSLTIESDPPGAEVYLDGVRQAGRTPLEIKELIPGTHLVSFQRRGYQPSTTMTEVRGNGEASQLFFTLERYPKNPLAPLDRVRQRLEVAEGEPTPTELQEGATNFGVDVLFLVRLQKREDEGGVLQPYLLGYGYDKRVDRIVVRIEKPATEVTLVEVARTLAQELVAEISADGKYAPPKPGKKKKKGKQPSDGTPFWKKKEFWYIVGGTAGGIVLFTSIGIGVGVTQANDRRRVAIDTAILGGQ